VEEQCAVLGPNDWAPSTTMAGESITESSPLVIASAWQFRRASPRHPSHRIITPPPAARQSPRERLAAGSEKSERFTLHREGLSPHLLAPPRSARLTNGGQTKIREARFQFDAHTGRLVDSGGKTATSKKDLKVGDQKEVAEFVSHVKRASAKLSQMVILGELVGKFVDEGLPENRGKGNRGIVACLCNIF
jgi:hypothetical protein